MTEYRLMKLFQKRALSDMLSFNFNKKKETGVQQVHIDGKVLYEGMV